MHPRRAPWRSYPGLLIWATGRQLRYGWRRLTRRCVLCGGKRTRLESGWWAAPLPYACRWCNKRAQHGSTYGMGANRLEQLIAEDKRVGPLVRGGDLQFKEPVVGRLSAREPNVRWTDGDRR